MTILETLCGDAARALRVPVAWIGFVSAGGEQIVAASGSKATHVPSASSFASRIKDVSEMVVVSDTTADPRFAEHPLVVGPPHVRFYAAASLGNGGTLSILDREPRTLNAEQLALFLALARHASREIQRHDELSEADERFREFFEQTTDLVLSLAPDGTVLHANEAANTLLGISRGASLVQAAEPERREELRRVFGHVFESASAERMETVFVTASGSRVTLEGWLRPKVLDGKAVLARVIFRDVTDRKQFEAELGNARDAALEAARVKTQFLTNVSHEIRTPMNGIVGMLDLVMATPLNLEQQDYAHQARASAEQLLSIVNNILYVSNLEAGTLSAALVDFDLYRAMQRIVEVMKVAALGKDLDVGLIVDPSLPPVFRGNLSKLRQVVTNLLENAVKFTERGSIVLSLGLQTETETHRVVRFDVRDTGIGIADEDRLLLFERFTQLDADSTRRFAGVGLGLSTARHLVETMGGLIEVESAPGEGSTFWFTVPFPKLARDRRPIVSSDLDLKGKRVLLVDHQPTSRKVVLHYLVGTWEMRVDVATDGADALAAVRAEAGGDPYRLVIFDRMDDLDPLGFAREIRRDAPIAGTSLVYLIVNDLVDEGTMRDAGINAYTAKPVGQRELFDAIAIAMAHEAIPLPRPAPPLSSTQPTRIVTPDQRQSIRVLLVEDNFLNMKLTMSQLQKLGYQADSVANGKEALEALSTTDYEVVLMDCQMPVMDGYQATLEIRRREAETGRRHRIIAMTANALEGDREKCLAAGMDDYLAKPTRHEELERALARYFVS
ncbi:MAG TPA: response regulator [Thermoanaerobaculia bacterium]|nr:response regulator [Thermoanaerobaculia bacterium]